MDVISMIKQNLLSDNTNPITKYFQVGKQTGSAGPLMVWKIYDAVRITDKKAASVFVFEKKMADKLHKPKRKEIVTEILRNGVNRLAKFKNPRLLRVLHGIEECHDSLAFASEPISSSLANLLGNHERLPPSLIETIKINNFSDIEIKYGILQVTAALHSLHSYERTLHTNISPQSVLVTRRGMWKLAGLGFAVQSTKYEAEPSLSSALWSTKQSKMAQPDLDFMAPEIQNPASNKCVGYSSDMFSLGLLICAIYNKGKPIIQANNAISTYQKQVEQIGTLFSEISYNLPVQLVESVQRMLTVEAQYRPTPEIFLKIPFFDDAVAQCMLGLNCLETMELPHKYEYFSLLSHTIPQIPTKLLYGSVLPLLMELISEQDDMLALVLPSLISIISNASNDDYSSHIQSDFKTIFNMSRPLQATVYLLEKLEIILDKSSEDDIKSDILPLIFNALESNSLQAQEASIRSFSIMQKYIDDQTIRSLVLPKAKALFTKSTGVHTRISALACIDRLLDCLDKMVIIDELIPFLSDIQCSDVDITMAIIGIYRHMLSDKKYGLTCNLLATKVMPTLVPHSVSPGLNIDQFNSLMEVLQGMLRQIDRQHRCKMISELPDDAALEQRTSLQQMYDEYMTNGFSNNSRYSDDILAMTQTAKRPSQGSITSVGSLSNYGKTSPRNSIDARYNTSLFDMPGLNTAMGNKYLLTVDEAQYSRYCKRSYNRYASRHAPSIPELLTKGASKESLGPDAYKKHSSFQGIGTQEQAELDKIIRERRASLLPQGQAMPHIMVSDYEDQLFYGSTSRRASTAGMWPLPVSGMRRNSRGGVTSIRPGAGRRSSIQGICETAVQFFAGK